MPVRVLELDWAPPVSEDTGDVQRWHGRGLGGGLRVFSCEGKRQGFALFSLEETGRGKERLLIIITDFRALCVTFCFLSLREEEVLVLEILGTGEQKNVPAVDETLAQEI